MRKVSVTVGASLALLARDRDVPSSARTLWYACDCCCAPVWFFCCWSMENSTTDSLNGPPEAEREKNGAFVAEAETFKIVGSVASSSVMALCNHAERMMIFMMIASRCRGMSSSPPSGSYVVNSQMVFTPTSVRVMLSGEPYWKYCRVHERSRSSVGVVKALDAAGFSAAALLVPDESLVPKIFNVSRRAESEMTKCG